MTAAELDQTIQRMGSTPWPPPYTGDLPALVPSTGDQPSSVEPVPESAAPVENPAVTKWRSPNDRWPVVAILHRAKRIGATVDGSSFSVRSNALADVLEKLPDDVEILYLLGAAPPKFRDSREWSRGPLPPGWERGAHFFGAEPIFRFRRPDGRRVKILHASVWGLSGKQSLAECISALVTLDKQIGQAFRGARLLDTPLATGRMLWQSSIPFGYEWPLLDAHQQQLIVDTSAQGRIEFLGHDHELKGLLELDGKLMYAACARELGIGPATHSISTEAPLATEQDFRRRKGDLSFLPGRYQATFQIPDDWAHIGLLGHWDGRRRTYPASSSEGHFKGWHDGAELLLAADEGWRFQVSESLTYDRADGVAGPLDKWTRALCKLEESAPSAVATAIRLIIVKTIGGFAQRGTEVERSLPLERSKEAPAKFRPRVIDGEVRWSQPAPVRLPDLSHPEWASQVWGKARARIAREALKFPREALLGIGLDALWLDSSAGDYTADKVGIGWLRRKSWRPGPLPPVQSVQDIRALRDGARG